MNETVNKLCRKCIRPCKQPESARIVRCKHFEKSLSDQNFDSIVKIMDETDRELDSLSERISKLTESWRSKVEDGKDIDKDEDDEENDEG